MLPIVNILSFNFIENSVEFIYTFAHNSERENTMTTVNKTPVSKIDISNVKVSIQ